LLTREQIWASKLAREIDPQPRASSRAKKNAPGKRRLLGAFA
jgi:hypothetical protein